MHLLSRLWMVTVALSSVGGREAKANALTLPNRIFPQAVDFIPCVSIHPAANIMWQILQLRKDGLVLAVHSYPQLQNLPHYICSRVYTDAGYKIDSLRKNTVREREGVGVGFTRPYRGEANSAHP